MSQPKTFACPACGAALNAASAAREIKCPYCASTVVVPADLRAAEPITIDLSNISMPDTSAQMSQQMSQATKVAVGLFGLGFLVPAIAGIVITVLVLIFTCVIISMVTTTIRQVVPPMPLNAIPSLLVTLSTWFGL